MVLRAVEALCDNVSLQEKHLWFHGNTIHAELWDQCELSGAGIHTGGGGGEMGDFPPLSKIPPPPFESAQVLK